VKKEDTMDEMEVVFLRDLWCASQTLVPLKRVIWDILKCDY
jgi:hypothetical protein